MSLFESIPYKVIKKDKAIEIREYNDFLLASTKTINNRKSDSGFMNVFNYISGDNEKSEKISMTTPVVSFQDETKLVTGFYVPRKYNQETVPDPSSKTVFINKVEGSLYAVIRFRGSWKEKHFNDKEQILRKYLNDSEYSIVSPRYVFRYQPPFVPGIFRRNEIAFQIGKSRSKLS